MIAPIGFHSEYGFRGRTTITDLTFFVNTYELRTFNNSNSNLQVQRPNLLCHKFEVVYVFLYGYMSVDFKHGPEDVFGF